MTIYLTVDEHLEKVQEWGLRFCTFDNQKHLNGLILDNWKSTSKNKLSAEYILEYQNYAKDKMVICLTDSPAGMPFRDLFFKKHISSISIEEFQEVYNKAKPNIDFRKTVVNSLRYHTDIALRRVMIHDYFRRNISPKVSELSIKNNRHIQINPGFSTKYSGWGYIAAFKPKILNEFSEKESCFWIKLLYNDETLSLVNQNFTKDKNNRIFIGFKDDAVRHIDIFTTDEGSANLLQIIIKDDHKVLNADLMPLIDLLKKYELMNALERKDFSTNEYQNQ